MTQNKIEQEQEITKNMKKLSLQNKDCILFILRTLIFAQESKNQEK